MPADLPKGPPGRVVFITTSYPAHPGDPTGHFVETEARSEARRGSSVTVLAPGPEHAAKSGSNPRVVRLPDGGAFGWPGAISRISERPLRLAGVLGFVWTACRTLRALGPFDRVVAHWIVPSAWPIALGCSAPLQVVAHGSDVRLLLRLPEAVRGWLIGALLRRGARFRFVSSQLRHQLCSGKLSSLLQHSRVASSPIDVSAALSRNEARSRLGVAAEQPLVVVVGRLLQSKRVEVALSAATLLCHTRVVVVGDGPHRQALAEQFPPVEFVGQLPRDEALAWIAAADVVVSASRSEGACTVVREALALGTPVVAAPSGDLAAAAESDPLLAVIASPPGR